MYLKTNSPHRTTATPMTLAIHVAMPFNLQ
jgi:hypothetical protein